MAIVIEKVKRLKAKEGPGILMSVLSRPQHLHVSVWLPPTWFNPAGLLVDELDDQIVRTVLQLHHLLASLTSAHLGAQFLLSYDRHSKQQTHHPAHGNHPTVEEGAIQIYSNVE